MRIFGNINKVTEQEDGTLLVEGIASSPNVDDQKEIVTAEAMKAAIPEYMKFGNVREMHDPKKAAGVATEIEVNEEGFTILKALIVDPVAIQKVLTKVYKGFSIAGKVIRDKLNKSTIIGLELSEISLVDRPSNPDAMFSCYKNSDINPDEEEPAQEEAPVVPEAAQVAEAEAGVEADTAKVAFAGGAKGTISKAADGTLTFVPDPDEEEVRKGSYSIGNLAGLCDSLEWFASCESYDSAVEGDASPIPATARKLAGQLYDLLLALVAEEVTEAKQRLKDASKAAEPGDLQKVAGAFTTLKDNLGIVGDELAIRDDDIFGKVAGSSEAINKLSKFIEAAKASVVELDELKTKVAAMPAPPKGVLISKVNDAGETEQIEVAIPNDPKEAAELLIKVSHQNPQRFR